MSGSADTPTAPVEASGSERDDEPTEAMIQAGLKVDFDNEDERATIINVWQAMIAFRPQPSGSEREDQAWTWLNGHVECDPADRDYSADEMVDAFMAGQSACVGVPADLVRRVLAARPDDHVMSAPLAVEVANSLSRPQPSGETRPTDEEIRSAIKATEYKYFGDYEFTEDQHDAVDILVRAAQALLSALPLALGGQQGVDRGRVEAIVREAVIAASVDVPEKFADRTAMRFEITQNATDALVSVLSTTPARAEAQDEGAAGEIERLMTLAAEANDDGELDQAMRLVQQADALYAHPSPPPAADADLYDASRIADQSERAAANLTVLVRNGGLIGEVLDMLLAKVRASSAADDERVRIAGEALEKADAAARSGAAMSAADYSISAERLGEEIYKITTPALAALKSTAAKEGGAPQGDAAPEAG